VIDKPSGPRDVQGPVWLERNQVRISLRTQAKHLTVYPLDGNGQRMGALESTRVALANGMATIEIQAELAQASPWYEVLADE